MRMSEYLAEMRHAVEAVVAQLHGEQDKLATLRVELRRLTAQTEEGYRRADFLALNPDLDDEGLGTAIHWDTYFGADKERFHKVKEVETVADRVAAREFSVAALSGNLLQYGKQGLSIRFGKNREGCPDGRLVAGLPLHEVIWQARNQAIHWEEGVFQPRTAQCFEHLMKHADPIFARYKERSMAYEVVRLLGWRSVDDFSRDMKLFDAS